jgi:predicted DNA-binding WGR domain protein
MTRYFEFVGGSSNKFWEVTTSTSSVTVRYGRIGTNGQSQTTPMASQQVAKRHAERLIRQKLSKGYVEKVPA